MSFRDAWSVALQLVPCSIEASGWTAGRGGGRLRGSAHTGVSEAKQHVCFRRFFDKELAHVTGAQIVAIQYI